jgi:hypothetical protein
VCNRELFVVVKAQEKAIWYVGMWAARPFAFNQMAYIARVGAMPMNASDTTTRENAPSRRRRGASHRRRRMDAVVLGMMPEGFAAHLLLLSMIPV